MRHGNRNGRVGDELWRKDGCCVAQEEEIVGCPGGCGFHGGGHIVYGAKGNSMEKPRFRHGFDACYPDFAGKAEGSGYFAEKSGLFVLRFREGDLNFRAKQGDWQSGEAGAGSEVEERGRGGVEVLGGEKTLTKMAADDIFRVADRCEVGSGVPLEEKIEIEGELAVERVG